MTYPDPARAEMIDSIATQNQNNYNVSRYDQMPWQTQAIQSSKNAAVLDQPILVWNERFNTEPALLIDFFRRISDFMLLNPHPLYGNHNPNTAGLYAVMDGKIKTGDYSALMRLFGDESAMPVVDNHFFHGAEKTLTSQIISQPFRWTTKNVNVDFAKESVLEDAKKGAKMGIQALLQGMMAQGDGGVAPLIDPRVKLPTTPDDWLSVATGQEQVEGTMWKILQDTNMRVNFQNLARQAVRHKFRVNAEFCHIEVINGRLSVNIKHPSQVRWIAGKPVETLDDPAVFGVQVNDYMTPTEIANAFGVGRLATGTGIKGVMRYIEKMFEKNIPRIGYDPGQSYWSSAGISADTGYYCIDDTEKQYTSTQVNWMNNLFYPRRGNMLLTNVLVQTNYFTMLREKRFSVERVSRDGSRRSATDRELKDWQVNRHKIDFDIDFTPVGKDTPNRSNIKTYARPQLWQFRRIGHDAFIDYGPYQYQPDFDEDTQERPRIGWPVKGQISYEKSMTLLGENDAKRANVLMQKVDMFLADMGFEEALIIDDAQGKDPISYRFNAKQTGLVRIDSTRYSNGNPAGMMHLKTVKISNATEQVRVVFAMVRELQLGYELRTGSGPDVQGMTSEYSSNKSQQQNIVNQQKLNIDFNWEHAQFMNQILQGCADIGKFHYAHDREVSLILSPREQEVLRMTRKLRMADYSVHLESGQVLSDKKKMLDQLVGQLMQSGGIDQAEALMEIIMSDNPAEGLARYRQISTQIREQKGQAAQAGQQQAADMLADKQAQRQHEILLKQMDIDKDLRVAAIKAESDRGREEFEGLMSDIKAQNELQQKGVDAQLQSEQAQQQAELDAKAQQQPQQ